MHYLNYIGILLLTIITLTLIYMLNKHNNTKETFNISGTSEISDNETENNIQGRLSILENRVSRIDQTLSTHFGTDFTSTDDTPYNLDSDKIHLQYLKKIEHENNNHSSIPLPDSHNDDAHDTYMKIEDHNNNDYHDDYMRVDNHRDHSDYVLISEHNEDTHEKPINDILSIHNTSKVAHNKTIQMPLKKFVVNQTHKHNKNKYAHNQKFRHLNNTISDKFDDYSLKTDLIDHNNVVDAHHNHDGVLNDHINSHMHGQHSHSDD